MYSNENKLYKKKIKNKVDSTCSPWSGFPLFFVLSCDGSGCVILSSIRELYNLS